MDKYLLKGPNINIGLELLMNSEKSKSNIVNNKVVMTEEIVQKKIDIEESISIFKRKVIDRIEAYHPLNKKEDIIDYYIDTLWYKILFESIDNDVLKNIYELIEKTKK